MPKSKSILSFLLIAFLTINAYSQRDYMDDIVNNACECIQEVSDTLDSEMYSMELGFCILEAAIPYKKQLKKDHNIDFDRIDEMGEELGMLVGLKMATVCPEALITAAGKVNDDEDETMVADEDDSVYIFEGEITAIDNNQFVVLSVKDMFGKTVKFYWLTFVESDLDLPLEYKDLLGGDVLISYSTMEIFDARIGEYRIINILQSIFSAEYYAE